MTRAQGLKTLKIAEARQLASSGAGRMLRQAAGLTNAELARAVGVDPSTCFRWENGERTPTGDQAVRYAEFLAELRELHSPRKARR
jgi:DNA-binding XRE family transcriptional regulator